MRSARIFTVKAVLAIVAGIAIAKLVFAPIRAQDAPKVPPIAPPKFPSFTPPAVPKVPRPKSPTTPPPATPNSPQPNAPAFKKPLFVAPSLPAATLAKAASFRLVATSTVSSWGAFRFDSATGQTWKPVTPDNSLTWNWQPLAEPGQLKPGDYDVQVASYVVKDAPQQRVVRLERSSGRSWILNQTSWTSIAELPHSAETPKAGFRLLLCVSASACSTFRLNPETGAAAQWVGSPAASGWTKLQESEPLPASDYQLHGVATLTETGTNMAVFRLDKSSGHSWGLRNTTWGSTPEGDAAPQGPPPKTGFQLVLSNTATTRSVFRLNPATGENWELIPENSISVWQKQQEREHLLPSDYDLQTVSYVLDDRQLKRVFRLDRKTGRAWQLGTDGWSGVAEESDFGNAAVPRMGFRLVTTSSAISWDACRLNPETGETWHFDIEGPEPQWVRLADEQQLLAGDYDLQMVSYVGANGARDKVVRLDRKTGGSWVAYDGSWHKIVEPPDFAVAPAAHFQFILSASAADWNAIRFNPSSGETWWLDYHDPWHVWVKVADAGPLPSSDYTFQLASFLDNQNNSRMTVIRLDRNGGRAWMQGNSAWIEIAEPK